MRRRVALVCSTAEVIYSSGGALRRCRWQQSEPLIEVCSKRAKVACMFYVICWEVPPYLDSSTTFASEEKVIEKLHLFVTVA